MFVLFSFLAFSVDVGFLAGARAEMRRSADSASLAGCWEMYRQLQNGSTPDSSRVAVRQSAAEYVAANRVINSNMTVDAGAQSQEILVGYLASLTGDVPISQDSSLPFLAVKVGIQKSAQKNGEIPFFFGKIFELFRSN